MVHRSTEVAKKYHDFTYGKRGSKLANSANAHKATIAHEYAHQIDNYYLFKKKPELYEKIIKYKVPVKLTTAAEAMEINAANKAIHSNSSKLSNVIFNRMVE